jgi:hypothetical protein
MCASSADVGACGAGFTTISAEVILHDVSRHVLTIVHSQQCCATIEKSNATSQ